MPNPDFRIFGSGFRAACRLNVRVLVARRALGGSLFDHSPMAPPIVHPVKVCITAGYLVGPGNLEKGGYGLSRRVGN